jgi:hypothetical protein
MASTHNYTTALLPAIDLDSTMVLVGESGGLSAVYDVANSYAMPGLLVVETEHGSLYLDPDLHVEVLA